LRTRVVVVADQHPLATESVVGRHALAQLGVVDLACEMFTSEGLAFGHFRGILHKTEDHQLASPVAEAAHELLCEGHCREQSLAALAHLVAEVRQYPRRRALEDLEACDHGSDLGTVWMALAPVPITPTRFPARPTDSSQRAVCIDRTRERIDALDVGHACFGEPSGGEHDVARLKDALAGREDPELGRRVKGDVGDVVVELDELSKVVFGCDVLEVRPDLGLVAEGIGPARVGFKGEGVKIARDVAATTGVRVVAPRSAEIAGALEQYEIPDPGVLSRMAVPSPPKPEPITATLRIIS